MQRKVIGVAFIICFSISLSFASYIDDTNWNGSDWHITASTVIAGKHVNIGNFLIDAGVTVTVFPSTVTSSPWQGARFGEVQIYASTISVYGVLTASGSGFGTGYGDGAGGPPGGSCSVPVGQAPTVIGGGGGGYGGYGGGGGNYTLSGAGGGPAYGLSGLQSFPPANDSALVGSGGGSHVQGDSGGGSIFLSGTSVTVNQLLVNGAKGVTRNTGDGGGGGGSGGTILIDAGQLTVSGGLFANGGDGDNGISCGDVASGGGGGGGGRIKLFYYSTGAYINTSVTGGAGGLAAGSGSPYNGITGGPGTVYNYLKPSAVSLLAPANGVSTGSLVSFSWTSSILGSATGSLITYNFQASTSSDFVSLSISSAGIPITSYSVYSVTGSPGTAYYWRVEAVDSNGISGPWSFIYSFSIPLVPSNVSTNWGGANWEISTSTTIAGMQTNIGTFVIDPGVTVTVQQSTANSPIDGTPPESDSGRFIVSATTAIVHGNITGDAAGYRYQIGPIPGLDASGCCNAGSAGGSYGGEGGPGGTGIGGGGNGGVPPPYTYGYAGVTGSTSDVWRGSGGGGGASSDHGGYGGGAISITCQYLVLDATVSANGESSVNNAGSCNGAAGGGAGGTVYFNASTITYLSGAISAIGGSGGNTNCTSAAGAGGAGGGGRIKIMTMNSNLPYSIINVNPGAVGQNFYDPAENGNLAKAGSIYYAIPPAILPPIVEITSVTVQWNANGNPAGTTYGIQFATSPDFINITSGTTTSLSFSTMGTLPNTTFYYRVQSYYSDLSRASAYVVAIPTATIALPPILNSPNWAGSDISTNSLTARWQNSNPAGATYIVQFATSTDFISSGVILTTFSTTSLSISSSVTPNWSSVFRVQAKYGTNDPSAWAMSVMTGSLVNQPTISEFTVAGNSVTVTIAPNGNPAGTKITISTGAFSIADSSSGIQSIPTSTLTYGEPLGNSTYTISAIAVNVTGVQSSPVTIMSSCTLANVPQGATIQSPWQVTTATVSYAWSAGDGYFQDGNQYLYSGTSYQVQLSSVSDFSSGTTISSTVISNLGDLQGSINQSVYLTDLIPNTVYYPRSRAFNIYGFPTAWQTGGVTRWTQPAQPVLNSPNFASTDVTSYSITANWSANGNPADTTYLVQFATSTDFTSSRVTITQVSTTRLSITTTSLALNSVIAFRVLASSMDQSQNMSPYATSVATATLTFPVGLNSPNWAVPDIGYSSVTARWNANGNTSGTLYRIQFATATDFVVITETTTTALSVSSCVLLNTQIAYRVRSENYSGVPSTFSASVSTWTLPAVPGASTFVGIAATSITVSWSTNGNSLSSPTSYQVLLTTDSAFSVYSTSITYLTQASINPLIPNNSYYFKVSAFGVGGTFSAFNSMIATQTYPNSPSPLGFSLSPTSVKVYLAGNGNPTGTIFVISTGSFAQSNSSSSLSGPGITTITLYGLTPNTSYTLQTEAQGILGDASTSTLIAASTYTLSASGTVQSYQVYTTSISFVISPNGNPAGTQFAMSSGTDGNYEEISSTIGVLGSGNTSITLLNLSTNTQYAIQLGILNPDRSTNTATVIASTYTLSVQPLLVSYTIYASSASVLLSPNSNPAGTTLVISTDPNFAASSSSQVTVSQTCTYNAQILEAVCSANNSLITFPQLVPNTTYNIWVRSINGTGSQSAITYVASTCTLPMSPGSIAFSKMSLTSMTVSWSANGNPQSPPTSYEIDMATSNDFASFTSSVTFALSFTTANLIPSENYYLRVRSFNQYGTPSSWVTGQAQTGGVSVGNGGLILTATSASASILRNGNGIGSAIVFSTGTNGNTSVLLSSQGVIGGDITNLAIAGLSTNTAYGFQGGLVGQSSVTIFAFSSYTLSVPPFLASYSLGSNSLSLILEANTNPPGTTFQVSTDNFNTISQGTGFSYAISSLAPNTSYTLWGRSVNFGGVLSGSSVLLSTTTLSQVPAGLVASFVSFNALTFSWNSNGNPSGTTYKLDFFLGTSQEISSQTVQGTQATYAGLAPGTNYTLQVRALNPDGSLTGAISLTQATKSFPIANAQVSVTTGSYDLTWSQQLDALALNIRDESNNLIAQLSSSAVSYSQDGFSQNQAITRSLEYYNQYITTAIATLTFHTAISPPASIGDVMSILSRTATSVTIQVTPPQGAIGQAGVRIRFIPAVLAGSPYYMAYLYTVKPPFASRVYHSPGFAIFATDPAGTIVATFQNGSWEQTVTGLLPGKNYVIKVSYLNSDGVESPVSSSSMNFFAGFSSSEIGIKAEKDTFFVSRGINFVVNSNNSGNGTIKIYGVNQNLVRQIPFSYAPGSTAIYWDGNDDQGQPVYTDVYWVVIEDQEFGKQTINVAGIR